MKKPQANLIAFLFLILFVSCNKDSDIEPKPLPFDISGEWLGYMLEDNIYTFNVKQEGNNINATITIPEQFNLPTSIQVFGKIEVDSTFSLSGTVDNHEIDIYGSLEDEHSLHIVTSGIEDEIQLIYMIKKELVPPSTLSVNDYELKLVLGEKGEGRSVILVHGMNDNPSAFEKMIDYFNNHDIGDSFNVWIFEYEWSRKIDKNGSKMAEMIQAKQDNGDINQNPIIIAHSMGGLVSRSYISKEQDFHRLITLGTPHLGSRLAKFASFNIAPEWFSSDGVSDLNPNSSFLKNLNSNTYEKTQRSKYWLLNGRVGKYGTNCWGKICLSWEWHHPKPTFIERRGHNILSKPNDGMVTRESASFGFGHKGVGDDSPHVVNTFEWKNHSYLPESYDIRKWVKDFVKKHP